MSSCGWCQRPCSSQRIRSGDDCPQGEGPVDPALLPGHAVVDAARQDPVTHEGRRIAQRAGHGTAVRKQPGFAALGRFAAMDVTARLISAPRTEEPGRAASSCCTVRCLAKGPSRGQPNAALGAADGADRPPHRPGRTWPAGRRTTARTRCVAGTPNTPLSRTCAGHSGQLRREYDGVPTALVGHSLGGRAALLAGDQPEVTSVVALNPWVQRGDRVDLAGRPALVVHGTEDRIADPGRAAELTAALDADNRGGLPQRDRREARDAQPPALSSRARPRTSCERHCWVRTSAALSASCSTERAWSRSDE